MSGAFRFSLVYLVCAFALMAVLTKEPATMLAYLVEIATAFSYLMYGRLGWLVPPLLLIVVLWLGPKTCLSRLGSVGQMVAMSVCLQIGFVFAKSAIPRLVPFYADPFLAQVDQTLFFGRDAWQIAHALAGERFAWLFPTLYMPVWSGLALGFPIVMALTDPDKARAGRYAWLFILAWVVVGNLLATLGSSVGPVYYDRLLGSDRFSDLAVALQQSGLARSSLGQVQDLLWAGSNDVAVPLSLISAFPSVHVAVATVVALYLRERAPRLAPVGYAFLGAISFISVYSGYHFAICAFGGWAVVVAMAAAMRRWAHRPQAAAPLEAWPPAASGVR